MFGILGKLIHLDYKELTQCFSNGYDPSLVTAQALLTRAFAIDHLYKEVKVKDAFQSCRVWITSSNYIFNNLHHHVPNFHVE